MTEYLALGALVIVVAAIAAICCVIGLVLWIDRTTDWEG